jgi:hypothetical protein
MMKSRTDTESGMRDPGADFTKALSQDVSVRKHELLELLTGSKTKTVDIGFEYFLERLEYLFMMHSSRHYEQLLCADFAAGELISGRILNVICAVIRIHILTPGVSIDKLVQRLVEDNVFCQPLSPSDEDKQKIFLFSILGWITCLYLPSPLSNATTFRIETSGSRYPQHLELDAAKVQRPFDEFLSAFGQTLPGGYTVGRDINSSTDDSHSKNLRFQVSSLNAATLKNVANVGIVWVDTISAHLDFDPTLPALYVFRSPAFCTLQAADSSILSK